MEQLVLTTQSSKTRCMWPLKGTLHIIYKAMLVYMLWNTEAVCRCMVRSFKFLTGTNMPLHSPKRNIYLWQGSSFFMCLCHAVSTARCVVITRSCCSVLTYTQVFGMVWHGFVCAQGDNPAVFHAGEFTDCPQSTLCTQDLQKTGFTVLANSVEVSTYAYVHFQGG